MEGSSAGRGGVNEPPESGDAWTASIPPTPRPLTRLHDVERALRPVTPRRAVILAGGRGTRLAPYTSILPKPLMPIGDRSILEIIVGQLADHGVRDIVLCVGHLSHLVRSVIDNLDEPRNRISYVHEQEALGTAGPLRLVEGLDETFLMMNGDILTTMNYRDLLTAHTHSGNILTVAARKQTIKVDYGMLHLDGYSDDAGTARITGWSEKPEIQSYVSMGVYVLEPEVLDYIPPNTYFDLPSLVQALLDAEENVGAYTYAGAWFDIGHYDDYMLAVEAWSNGELQSAAPGDLVSRPFARVSEAGG